MDTLVTLHGITGQFLVEVCSRRGTERGAQIHTAHWFGPCHPCTEEIIKELSMALTLSYYNLDKTPELECYAKCAK